MTVAACLLSRSLLGAKRTCPFALHMSKADIVGALPLFADEPRPVRTSSLAQKEKAAALAA